MINNPSNVPSTRVLSMQSYQDIIYSSSAMIAIFKGKDMLIDLANHAIIETWGKGENILGLSLFSVLPEIIEQGYVEILANVYTTGKTFSAYEMPVTLKRNGKLELLHYTFTYQAQYETDGTITGILLIGNEVSIQALSKKRLEESESHSRLVVEMIPEKVTNATPEGNVIFYNKSWQEYTGKNLETLLQEGWAKWIHPDDLEEVTQKWFYSVATGEDFDMELRMLNHLGAYRWHTSKAQCIKDGEGHITLWVGFNTDVHDQKEQNKELENSVSKRTTELQNVNAELQQKNKLLILKNKEIEDSKGKTLSDYARNLIEASNDPMIVISPKGKITDVNQATINTTGKARQKLLNTNFYDYFTEPQKAKEVYQEVFLRGFVNDYPLTIKDHKPTHVLFNGSVYKDENGKVLGAVVVARDITEQREKEYILQKTLKELSDYKYALDASSIVEVTDKYGVIKFVNDNFCKISQYTASELVGNTHLVTSSGFHSKLFMTDLWQTISSGKIWKSEMKNKAKDGTFYWVLTTIVPFLDIEGIPYQYVAIRSDITEQKRIEQEINEAKEHAELATSFAEEAQSKAEEAVKAKQQFLSNMSHEIRTPMNAIIGFTKVLLKTELSGKQREYLNAIKMSGDALIVLINDILDLAKVDAGKMSFEKIPFKLASSIASMLHLFETKIQEKNLRLVKEYDTRIPEVLLGDPVRLHQIILNLVSNAVKFTSTGTITVSIRQVEEDEEQVTIEFSVKDTGIGIAASKMERIFDNFQQASSETSRIFGGTGLGLSIVKQLVEPQGGTIHLESELNVGSRFSFILSFLKTGSQTTIIDEITELDTEITNIKVLVVEDIALNQLLMKTLLDDFGFYCEIVSNGKLAIEKLATESYDIILMDLQMPEMNGFEATQYIRNILKLPIPIIALTADVTTVDLAKCKEVGMNDYIAKPVDDRFLYSKIVGLVKSFVPEKEIKTEKIKYTDLSYLIQRTKANPVLIMEMINLYLAQTPSLILSMKQSLRDKDWAMLGSAVHKMIPSFAIMGIQSNFEKMARQVQEYAVSQQLSVEIHDLVYQLENACGQACEELKEELEKLKTTKNE